MTTTQVEPKLSPAENLLEKIKKHPGVEKDYNFIVRKDKGSTTIILNHRQNKRSLFG